MTALDIAVTPINYAVWYEYCLGNNPKLNHEINALLGTGSRFTPTINDRLFREFLGHPDNSERLNHVQVETHSLVTGLIEKIKQVSLGTMNFSVVLNEFNEQLQDKPDEATLNELITGIGSELAEVIRRNQGMSLSLAQMGKEVGELRQEMESLQREVMTDPLTTLYNRRAFDLHLHRLFHEATRATNKFAMLAIDIDFFKKINDTHGHQAGDKVIAYIGRLLKRSVRSQDFVARYGGEEFVAILPHTQLVDAVALAEKLRGLINEKKLSTGGDSRQSLGRISVSIGVSVSRPGDQMEDCFKRADEALYQAKAAGRNCVKAAGQNNQTDRSMSAPQPV
ncbi:GGDEF domain-containing protein [Shewanella sp. GXUN23E]|uniref:GGDEF domain-containing protein n=1 Tax=Shewanella sp. GXUN23E TaxID=3422498 RepID=UPI003D7E0573